ncbi:hypothetical protein [Malonomonas rubra]|uniref:hypothetical protein n=1 Tax=Malonomonas rubra TaxID=57040 RepID=UPI0026EC4DD1|nr:hypothetical protein [Malonomonas rubra]
MSGPGSIYAIAEMNKRAEEYSLKVRSELFRIGCSPRQISVIRQGSYLQMKYQQQVILVPPQGILSVLQKIPQRADSSVIWERVCEHSRFLEKQSQTTCGWLAAVASLLVLLVFLFFFLKL